MKRYPIDKFYVGKLNFGFRFGNLLNSQEFNKHDMAQSDLRNSTLFKGAIDIKRMSCADLTDWQNRIRYDSLFTIFYKNDDDNYTCLHNGITYHCSGETYCSDLVPLSKCIPEVASKVDPEITCFRAKHIFDILFKEGKKNLYTHEKFLLDYFYLGNLELFSGKNNEDANLAQRLILNSKGIASYGGCIRYSEVKDSEFSYEFYRVIILWLDLSKIYNINDCRLYEPCNTLHNGESKVEIVSSLKEDPYFGSRIDGDMASIPEILRLQRRMKKS